MRIIVNCAMTADGKIASKERKQLQISTKSDMIRVHNLRAEADAILVGVGTVLADDPKLTVKQEYVPGGRNPVRVVLDSHGKTPKNAKVLNKDAPTLLYTTAEVDMPGVEVVRIAQEGRVPVKNVVKDLLERGMETLLVEGGGETIWSFFDAGLVEEYNVFVGSQIVGGKTCPTPVDGEGRDMSQGGIQMDLVSTELLGNGVLLSYRVR